MNFLLNDYKYQIYIYGNNKHVLGGVLRNFFWEDFVDFVALVGGTLRRAIVSLGSLHSSHARTTQQSLFSPLALPFGCSALGQAMRRSAYMPRAVAVGPPLCVSTHIRHGPRQLHNNFAAMRHCKLFIGSCCDRQGYPDQKSEPATLNNLLLPWSQEASGS